MEGGFAYKPRFRDIRIKPPKDEPDAHERVCEWPGCPTHGDSRAPKAKDRLNEFHWFCQSHAAEYNRAWNYFEGMNEAELAAFNASAHYGHRPTWTFRGNTGARAKAGRATKDFRDGFADPFGLFGRRPANDRKKPPEERRRTGRLQEMAFETMGLEDTATSGDVRKRYAELVKRFHPDSNAGDRSSEEQLGRVIRAYQILKNAGLV